MFLASVDFPQVSLRSLETIWILSMYFCDSSVQSFTHLMHFSEDSGVGSVAFPQFPLLNYLGFWSSSIRLSSARHSHTWNISVFLEVFSLRLSSLSESASLLHTWTISVFSKVFGCGLGSLSSSAPLFCTWSISFFIDVFGHQLYSLSSVPLFHNGSISYFLEVCWTYS